MTKATSRIPQTQKKRSILKLVFFSRAFMRQHLIAQMDAYEAGGGYFFWTAKTENNVGPEWDFLFLLENGIAPANLCERETYCL